MKPITQIYQHNMGSDPEFFFRNKEGKIIGSEKVIPEKGLMPTDFGDEKIIRDGVQAEINITPTFCREAMGDSFEECMNTLDNLKENGITPDFSQLVKINKKELKELSPKSRIFGCAPSLNIYEKGKSRIEVNPNIYRYRSAGGHIHIGTADIRCIDKALKQPERVIPMMDIILGNTCVLIDRDRGNKERRKVYGKAGEYRIQEWGLEYRTLSNFWLRSYQLMSLVFGLERLALNIVAQSTKKDNYEKAILKVTNIEDIKTAINTNNAVLARKNFKKILPIILEITGGKNIEEIKDWNGYDPDYNTKEDIEEWIESEETEYYAPITKSNIKYFNWFIRKGINHWFNKDPIENWINTEKRYNGWETFLKDEVAHDWWSKNKKEEIKLSSHDIS